MSKLMDKILAKMAKTAAMTAAGTASTWNGYQPQEPKNIKEHK